MDDLAGWAAALAETRTRTDDSFRRICELCVRALGVSGGGISLMSAAGARGLVCATDQISARVEELQFTLGEGPCLQAVAANAPVLVNDVSLHGDAHVRQWPTFAAHAAAVGVGALFAFPLRVSGVNVGAMDLYRSTVGPMSGPQLEGALLAAETAATALRDLDFEVGLEPGSGQDMDEFHVQVHQATGMVMIQLGVSSPDALSTLRARSFSTGVPLTALARDVVERRLRFAEEDQ